MKRFALLVLVACTRQSAPTTIRADAPTPLQIVVLDDYSSRETCDGVAPRKVEISVDGKPAGVIEVPCRTKTVMPPPQVPGPTITLAAGTHTFVAREVGLGNSVEQELEFPVIVNSADDGTDELATKLPVWVTDDEIQITAPKAKITFESSPAP
ncbi:MAG: hypothetical protein M4D80_34830 [Myxococcota bacterium]|nr:hypothetical protein [Myxococcota bacterium]